MSRGLKEDEITDIEKRPNESDLDYQKRIIYGKLVDKTLADYDYSELAKLVYGKDYAPDVARRMFYGSRNTLDLIGSGVTESESSESIRNQITDLKKERQKFFDERTAYNKLIREQAREETMRELISRCINENLPELPAVNTTYGDGGNDLLVSLNDIHYGVDIDNFWNHYNTSVCADYMAEYSDKIIEIAERHNSEDCFVFGAGDFINGAIHKSVQLNNRENVVQQVMGVSELIAQFLAKISEHFRTVYFMSVGGNHSRIDKKDDAPLDERLDDLVEWYVSARLQNLRNVKFRTSVLNPDSDPLLCKIDSTMCLMEIRGKYYCGVHGDYDASKANIQSLRAAQPVDIYAVLLGHLHHNSTDTIDGIKVLMAGSFMGTDSYCVQKRIFGNPEQMVCVCDDTGIVCHYDVAL